eukprot:COSAG02_NODE_30797_length_545_cov_0.952915_1_plen_96_part_10
MSVPLVLVLKCEFVDQVQNCKAASCEGHLVDLSVLDPVRNRKAGRRYEDQPNRSSILPSLSAPLDPRVLSFHKLHPFPRPPRTPHHPPAPPPPPPP